MSRDDVWATGPHDLIITTGDCDLYGKCACGKQLGDRVRPHQSLDVLVQRWSRHVMEEHRGCDCEGCTI